MNEANEYAALSLEDVGMMPQPLLGNVGAAIEKPIV